MDGLTNAHCESTITPSASSLTPEREGFYVFKVKEVGASQKRGRSAGTIVLKQDPMDR